jgi:hypothetical protein
LNTPIIGPSAKIVASSWIDMLAGLSGLYIRNMPPGFWADAGSATATAINATPVAKSTQRCRFIAVRLPRDASEIASLCSQ